jgi:Leucine-rich repeat (LRR) protein
MIDDENNRSLVSLPDTSLATTKREVGRVLSEMASETLALARQVPLFKLGGYDWCPPDYEQILLWAEQLALEPEEVIRRLLDERTAKSVPSDIRAIIRDHGNDPDAVDWTIFQIWPATLFRDGRIVKLNWDLDLLPLIDFRWVAGLQIKGFRIIRSQSDSASISNVHLSLPDTLTILICDNLGLRELDVSHVSGLEYLSCSGNELASLDLSRVPKLERLTLSGNRITTIDLSRVPRLEGLKLDGNHVKSLDVSGLPKLRLLSCDFTQLTSLDLSRVPDLEGLFCCGNQIEQLDIRPLRNLQDLFYKDDSRCRTILIQRPDQHFS